MTHRFVGHGHFKINKVFFGYPGDVFCGLGLLFDLVNVPENRECLGKWRRI
jgi:hypothetical protein